MLTLGERVDGAIKASGRTADEIARVLGVAPDTISRIRTGKEDNPKLQLLISLAREVNTTVGALLGESSAISAEDEQELLRFRGWIDSKLMTVDARQEPNAIIVRKQATQIRESRIADRAPGVGQRIDSPFGGDVHLVLQVVGESMTGAGIRADDTLYAVAPGSNLISSAVGKIIACRIGEALFVKRLVAEHRRFFLLSEHPRYRPIRVDANDDSFEILGVIVGRSGRIN
ncbi:MAG TPA: S24 family peptidase [Thermoanaerobaculia bacterium]|nr:S24 family peptidase [Thermoanaerobaculia bacterium]